MRLRGKMTLEERGHVRKERTGGFFRLFAPGKRAPGSPTPKTKTVFPARVGGLFNLYASRLQLWNQQLVEDPVMIDSAQQLALVTLCDEHGTCDSADPLLSDPSDCGRVELVRIRPHRRQISQRESGSCLRRILGEHPGKPERDWLLCGRCGNVGFACELEDEVASSTR